jgi:nickel-dependent lactate racemase
MPTLRYGVESSLAIDLPDHVLVAECSAPAGIASGDIARAVRAALSEPLHFPPLAQATVPGDKIVLALEPGVPQAAAVVAAVVEYLCEAGASPEDITVLRTLADVEAGAADPRERLSGPRREAVQLETHDPQRREQLCYLAATRHGRPIYLNRALCDADLVIPIGCLRCREALDYHGIFGGLYPTFSDVKTLQRFRNPNAADAHTEIHAKAQHEVDAVGWLAGTQFAVEVLPGADGSLLAVFAGEAEAVSKAGQRRSDETWSQTVPQRASLVICGVTGEAARQTWDNVGRALAAALRVVADDGAIALCTDLNAGPGPALQRLAGADDLGAALRHIRKERPDDTVPATELGEALRRAKVYLLSRLDHALVEDLGVAPVSEPDDIARLARRHRSCILLSDAQYAVATPLVN